MDQQSELTKAYKIVLAEDEKRILGIYSVILSASGFDVVRSFENGKDLVDFVKVNKDQSLEPDVVITDLRMPEMDGIEAAKIIRATKPSIKIILASAYEVPPEAAALFDVRLKKPFGKNELLDAVLRSLELRL